MKNFYRAMTGVNITPLMLAIQRQPELWHADTYLRDYPQGPFGEIDSIILRFPEKSVKKTQAEVENHLLTHDPHESIDYPAYAELPEARPLIMGLMAAIGGVRLGRCMINRIKPNGRIFPHADTPIHADYWQRYHIVLHSNAGVFFRCGEESVYMAVGEIWWFENAVEHEVINNSADDRIHLIVDIKQ
ncbi:MAG: aspartyl/asparaginyl beta-hydroxylase domain-containing protein [Patescibacteria group bacterium]|nr:aspartyl/asparaginyl beta-hydroxylase domain-containing protein [Patescibacteria group bacterium]